MLSRARELIREEVGKALKEIGSIGALWVKTPVEIAVEFKSTENAGRARWSRPFGESAGRGSS